MKAARTRSIIATEPEMVTLDHRFVAGLLMMSGGYVLSLLVLISEIRFKKHEACIKSQLKGQQSKL